MQEGTQPENAPKPTEKDAAEESPQVESENSPEGSDEKTTQKNVLSLN
jgi:hypothetical protein